MVELACDPSITGKREADPGNSLTSQSRQNSELCAQGETQTPLYKVEKRKRREGDSNITFWSPHV